MANKIYVDQMRGRCPVITIGNNGEACDTEVYFPVDKGYTATVYVKRCGDTTEKSVTTTKSGGYVVWTVSSYDLEKVGCGQCEVVYKSSGITEKSITYNTLVHSNGYSPICWQCV